MNFRGLKAKQRHSALDINLTPLVDVVLQLVLFFMVTAQFAVLPGLTINLPTLGDNKGGQIPLADTSGQERLEIAITAQNDIYFEGEISTLKNLDKLIDRTGASRSDAVFLISADKKAEHGSLLQVMDLLNRMGFKRMVIAGEPEKIIVDPLEE